MGRKGDDEEDDGCGVSGLAIAECLRFSGIDVSCRSEEGDREVM